ncbi:hypothetical protein EDB81DRAFT_858463 [Dactylonectria macrodidyma]|uniref:Uncharacterized protein n=1 Tax=Dactylonectria macrodidyma TaxID=307937 RepID=A0A9P9IZ93_9HYPO|nr:hypothetical protein EDB81DRAFT_858463 [Dactylonectria macrodidyma]
MQFRLESDRGRLSPDTMYSDQYTASHLVHSEHGTMPCVVGKDPPSRGVSHPTLCVRRLIASVAVRDFERTRRDGFPQVVAGSWGQTSPGGWEIIEIAEEERHNSQHFEVADSKSVTIFIALPEKRLRQLIEMNGEDLESLPKTNSTIRRLSAILRLSNLIVSSNPNFRASFCHTLDLRYHETRLLIRWDMEYMSTKGAVHFRLGKLKELFENIEAKRQSDSKCPLPSLCGIAVCVTIPWTNYSHWAQGYTTDDALDTLWEQGIVATLPVLVKVHNNTVEPHVWCPAGLNNGPGTRWREVHAIIQEYVHPGLPPETGNSSSETRFIVVVYKTGDPSEWIEVVQSTLSHNPGQMLKPYQLSPNGMCIDVDDLARHCQEEIKIARG